MSDEELIMVIHSLGITPREMCFYAIIGIQNQLASIVERKPRNGSVCYSELKLQHDKLLGLIRRG